MSDVNSSESTTATPVPRDVIVVEGPETAEYLHGQVSQDILDLEIGESRLSLLLEPRGRLEVLFRVTRAGDDVFVLDSDPGAGTLLRSSLERFKLRTKAEFSEPGWSMLAVRGPDAAEVAQQAEGEVVAAAILPVGGFDVFGPAPRSDNDPDPRHAESRAAAGLPVMGVDLREGDIPNETGLLDLAVSFTKGCYRGQELVERIDSRAGGRRTLMRFAADGSLEVGDALDTADPAGLGGEVRSVVETQAGTVGFALVDASADDATHSSGVAVKVAPVVS